MFMYKKAHDLHLESLLKQRIEKNYSARGHVLVRRYSSQEFVLSIGKMANVKFYPCIMLYVSKKYHLFIICTHVIL